MISFCSGLSAFFSSFVEDVFEREQACIPSKNGTNSSLVRSGPKARAMVDRRWIALSLRTTSSACEHEKT